MVLRIALFAIPTATTIGLVLLLNELNAGAGIAVAALGAVAVASGAGLGYFSDRLPELPQARRHRAQTGTHPAEPPHRRHV